MEEEQLKELFQTYGNIIRLTILKNADKTSKGIGFLTFKEASSAEASI